MRRTHSVLLIVALLGCGTEPQAAAGRPDGQLSDSAASSARSPDRVTATPELANNQPDGLVAERMEDSRARAEAIAAIEALGGETRNDPDDGSIMVKLPAKTTNGDLARLRAHLNSLTNLKVVVLSRTEVTDAGLEHLAGLENLQGLDLSDAGFTDAGLEHLSTLTNLKQLRLVRAQITDSGLKHLTALTHLEGLDLSGTYVTNAALESLTQLTALHTLALASLQITDSGIERLTELTNLARLDLRGTQITDAGLKHLQELRNLAELRLGGTQISDTGLKHLQSLTALRRLGLPVANVTEAGQQILQEALTECRISRSAKPPPRPREASGLPDCSIVVRQRWSDDRVTLNLEHGTALEAGRILHVQREEADGTLTIDAFEDLLSDASVDPILERRVEGNIDNVPLLKAAAQLAEQLHGVVGYDLMGHPSVQEPIADSPYRHWTVSGPILLVARIEPAETGEIAKAEQLRLSSWFVRDEIKIWPRIQVRDVEAVTATGRAHRIDLIRQSDGQWIAALPVASTEVVAIRGQVTAMVARDILQIRVRPGDECQLDEPYEVHAKCAPVEKSERVSFGPPGNEWEYKPKPNYQFLHHTTVRVEWQGDLTQDELQSFSADFSRVFLDDERSESEDTSIERMRSILETSNVIEFARNINASPSARLFSRWSKTDAFWGPRVYGAPRAAELSNRNRLELCLLSEHQDEVDTLHELFLRRHQLHHGDFVIDVGKAENQDD